MQLNDGYIQVDMKTIKMFSVKTGWSQEIFLFKPNFE